MSFWTEWLTRDRTRRLHEIAERRQPTAEDEAWLRDAAERDPQAARTHAGLRRWHALARSAPAARAPEGFADRVLARARAEEAAPARPRPRMRWGLVGLAAAAGVAAFVVGVEMRPGAGDIARSGSSGFWTEATPDLVIHVEQIGAVEARQIFERTVRGHDGLVERLDTGVVARVERDSVAPLLRALADRGPFEVTRPGAVAQLPARVMLRLELASPSTD